MKKRKPNNKENWSHKNDFPIEEVWNTDNTLSQLIVPRLLAFKALDKQGRVERGSFTLTLSQNRAWKSPLTRLFTLYALCICFFHHISSLFKSCIIPVAWVCPPLRSMSITDTSTLLSCHLYAACHNAIDRLLHCLSPELSDTDFWHDLNHD